MDLICEEVWRGKGRDRYGFFFMGTDGWIVSVGYLIHTRFYLWIPRMGWNGMEPEDWVPLPILAFYFFVSFSLSWLEAYILCFSSFFIVKRRFMCVVPSLLFRRS